MTELRCKPGDLALIIKGNQAGLMLTCIRLEDPERCTPKYQGAVWLVDREVQWYDRGTDRKVPLTYAPDVYLIPIRPEPDEEDAWFTAENKVPEELKVT